MDAILTIIWLFLPIGVANMAPVLANNIPALKRYTAPLDHGQSWRGKRIFGENKTYRGLIAGIVAGTAVALLQALIYSTTEWPAAYSAGFTYGFPIVLLFGACLGFGAVAGDVMESFFKRRANIAPGKSWVPFDQTDFYIGGALFSLPFIQLPLAYYFVGLGIVLFLHPATNVISWLLGMQDKPF